MAALQSYPWSLAEAGLEESWDFGHDKRQVLSSPTEEQIFSQCFCIGCRSSEKPHPIELNTARRTIHDLLQTLFDRPQLDLPRLESLISEQRILRDLFDFRVSVVSSLFKHLADDAAGDTPLNYYVMEGGEFNVDDIWLSGAQINDIVSHVVRQTPFVMFASG